jgi:hypothetical protein
LKISPLRARARARAKRARAKTGYIIPEYIIPE